MSDYSWSRDSSGGSDWPTISIPFEWVVADDTGVSSGPIRRGQIVGGKFDGAFVRTAPSA